jgi:hypothetical protein
MEWVWQKIERIHVGQEATACIDRWLYFRQYHSRLQEGRKDGGKLPALSPKTPQASYTAAWAHKHIHYDISALWHPTGD